MKKLLKLDNTATVQIGGVLDDIPQNTDFPLGVIASYETIDKTILIHMDIQTGGAVLRAVSRHLCYYRPMLLHPLSTSDYWPSAIKIKMQIKKIFLKHTSFYNL